MDSSAATGGIMLLVILIIAIVGFIGLWKVMAAGYIAYESKEHKKFVERSVRQAYEDENTRRNYARKMLADYEDQ